MKVVYTTQARADIKHWIKFDQKIYKKVYALIDQCKITPFTGTGNPEPLRHDHPNWSRRLTRAYRLIYYVEGSGEDRVLTIVSAKDHY